MAILNGFYNVSKLSIETKKELILDAINLSYYARKTYTEDIKRIL